MTNINTSVLVTTFDICISTREHFSYKIVQGRIIRSESISGTDRTMYTIRGVGMSIHVKVTLNSLSLQLQNIIYWLCLLLPFMAMQAYAI